MTKALAAGLLILILIVVVISLLTYGPAAEDAMPLTMLRYLPEDIHWAEGTKFDFACIETDVWLCLTETQQRSLLSALKRRDPTVYLGFDAIPQELKVYRTVPTRDVDNTHEDRQVLQGLRSGCIVG